MDCKREIFYFQYNIEIYFLVSSSDIMSGVPERRSKSFNYICGKCLFDTILTIYRHTFYIE